MMTENLPCLEAVAAAGAMPLMQVSKAAFDAAYDEGHFADPPRMEAFGDGYGEPYRPNRQAWGQLLDGSWVWAWVLGEKAERSFPEASGVSNDAL